MEAKINAFRGKLRGWSRGESWRDGAPFPIGELLCAAGQD